MDTTGVMTTSQALAVEPKPAFHFVDTTATQKVFALRKRLRCVCGGTSASKTISILVWCIDYCGQAKNANKLVSVVSETFPHLRKGAMLDFQNIMKDRGYWSDESWNKSESTYTFLNGAKIEFFSADNSGKVHGPRRDVLFVNECNHVAYDIFDHLRIRTREVIWLDWNPSEEFWFYTELQPNYDLDFITLTYKDNEGLDVASVEDIEAHRHNKMWWQVYGMGQLGEVEGRIYTGWRAIDEVPFEARLERRGLDFGFSIDPAALVDVYYHDGGYILDERLYLLGQSNRRIATFLLNMEQPQTLVAADSAEPKSIAELQEYGAPVIAADKGPGSVNRGIQFLQDQRVSYTKRSLNIAKEYRRYYWKSDDKAVTSSNPQGFLQVPAPHQDDHALDAIRYAVESLRPKEIELPPRIPDSPAQSLIY